MLNGISFCTADETWRRILTDLGAELADKALIDFDVIKPSNKISAQELCQLILSAATQRRAEIIFNLVGNARLSDTQEKILIALHLRGPLDSKELNSVIGHAPDAESHAAATAISSLRSAGLDIVRNVGGRYEI
jgi:hypothetical protein